MSKMRALSHRAKAERGVSLWKHKEPFFVQKTPRGLWHVESLDDPEKMLCGEWIGVDESDVKVSKRWGLKPCPWCEKLLDEATEGRFSR